MTQTIYWPKAFGISCISHLLIIFMMGLLVGNIPINPPAEQYIVIDLTQFDTEGIPLARPEEKTAAFPVTPGMSAPAPNSTSAMRPIQGFDMNKPATTDYPFAGNGDDGELMPAKTGEYNGKLSTGAGNGAATATSDNAGNGNGSNDGVRTRESSETGIDSAILAFLAEVEKHKDYPYIARRRGYEGVVTIFVELSSGGELRQVRVEKSSGYSLLDEAAAEVVRRVSPFHHGLGRPVAMKIPISYQLLP